jgi:hypothetical protein
VPSDDVAKVLAAIEGDGVLRHVSVNRQG